MADEADAPPRRAPPLAPEMNVTPLVDVVLVLLIIFMVVTPQMESGAALDLPVVTNPDKGGLGEAQPPTIVSLAKDGQLYLDKKPVTEAELDLALTSLHERQPDAKVVVKADRQAAYGKVRSLFKRCQGVGLPGVSVQVIDRANQQSHVNGS